MRLGLEAAAPGLEVGVHCLVASMRAWTSSYEPPQVMLGSDMTCGRALRLLRPGWSHSRARSLAIPSLLVRAAVVAFVLHLSGAAHMLADILLDDDMTCVDEQAHHGSTEPNCPAAQGVGQGQRFVPAARDAIWLPPPETRLVPYLTEPDLAPPFVAPGSIDRPPRV